MMDFLKRGKPAKLDDRLCTACGGMCCKTMPGHAWPGDFTEPLEGALVAAFMTGQWAIDNWEGDPTADGERICSYYVRIAADTDNGNLFYGSWGGRCALLTENGCPLPADQRPRACRMLTPMPVEGECKLPEEDHKHACALAWYDLQDVIQDAARKARGEENDERETDDREEHERAMLSQPRS